MIKAATAPLLLLLSACAQSSANSDIGQARVKAEDGLERVELAADATCPHTAIKIHQMAIEARQAYAGSSPVVIKAMTDAMLSLAEVCKSEKQSCGQGPAHIGMTPEQAIRTSWCFPEKKNTTETAGHAREQWIYPGRGYLYFDNGRLSAIQESN